MSSSDDDVKIAIVGSVGSRTLSVMHAMKRAGLPVVVIEPNEHASCDCVMQPRPEPIIEPLPDPNYNYLKLNKRRKGRR